MARIELSKGLFAEVDEADLVAVSRFRWHAIEVGGKRYAATKSGGRYRARSVLLHRLLVSPDGSKMVDHIDGDGLNCRRSNLRIASASQNQGNRRRNRSGSSRFKGVGWHAGAKKWRARITRDGRVRELGLFVDEADAARAYDAAAREQFGAFAAVNFPVNGEACALRSA